MKESSFACTCSHSLCIDICIALLLHHFTKVSRTGFAIGLPRCIVNQWISVLFRRTTTSLIVVVICIWRHPVRIPTIHFCESIFGIVMGDGKGIDLDTHTSRAVVEIAEGQAIEGSSLFKIFCLLQRWLLVQNRWMVTRSSLRLPFYSLFFAISEANNTSRVFHHISGFGHRKHLLIHRHAHCSNHTKQLYTKLSVIFRPHHTSTNMYSQ